MHHHAADAVHAGLIEGPDVVAAGPIVCGVAGLLDGTPAWMTQQNPTSLGIFGFSYLDANKDKIKAVPVQGVSPTYAAIADGSYPGSRPLFIYIKKAHVGVVPGLAEYVAEFLKGAGDGGYLNAKGLIVSPNASR